MQQTEFEYMQQNILLTDLLFCSTTFMPCVVVLTHSVKLTVSTTTLSLYFWNSSDGRAPVRTETNFEGASTFDSDDDDAMMDTWEPPPSLVLVWVEMLNKAIHAATIRNRRATTSNDAFWWKGSCSNKSAFLRASRWRWTWFLARTVRLHVWSVMAAALATRVMMNEWMGIKKMKDWVPVSV